MRIALQRKLCANDTRQANFFCSMSKSDNTAHVIMIGKCQGIQSYTLCMRHQFFRIRCTIKQRESRMAMKFSVFHSSRLQSEHKTLLPSAVSKLQADVATTDSSPCHS